MTPERKEELQALQEIFDEYPLIREELFGIKHNRHGELFSADTAIGDRFISLTNEKLEEDMVKNKEMLDCVMEAVKKAVVLPPEFVDTTHCLDFFENLVNTAGK